MKKRITIIKTESKFIQYSALCNNIYYIFINYNAFINN